MRMSVAQLNGLKDISLSVHKHDRSVVAFLNSRTVKSYPRMNLTYGEEVPEATPYHRSYQI